MLSPGNEATSKARARPALATIRRKTLLPKGHRESFSRLADFRVRPMSGGEPRQKEWRSHNECDSPWRRLIPVSGPNKRRSKPFAIRFAALCVALSLALFQHALPLSPASAHNSPAGSALSASLNEACRSDASREAPPSGQGHRGDHCLHCLAGARELLANLLPAAVGMTLAPPIVLRIALDRASDRQPPSPVEAVPWSSRAPPFFS